MSVRTYRLITILRVNGLNASTKRHRQVEWIRKQALKKKERKKENKTYIYAAHKRPTSDLGTYTMKVRGRKRVLHANGIQKRLE